MEQKKKIYWEPNKIWPNCLWTKNGQNNFFPERMSIFGWTIYLKCSLKSLFKTCANLMHSNILLYLNICAFKITKLNFSTICHKAAHKCTDTECFQQEPTHIYTTTRVQPQLLPHTRSPGKAPAELKHPVNPPSTAYPLWLGHGLHWMTPDYFHPTNLSPTASRGGDATQPFLPKSRCAQTTMKESSFPCS